MVSVYSLCQFALSEQNTRNLGLGRFLLGKINSAFITAMLKKNCIITHLEYKMIQLSCFLFIVRLGLAKCVKLLFISMSAQQIEK